MQIVSGSALISSTLLVIGLIAIGIFVAVVRNWQRDGELHSIEKRPSLDDDAIYSSYYMDSKFAKESIIDVWHEIATALGLPAEKLRPNDRFGKEVGADLITSERLDTLYDYGRRRAIKMGLDIDFSKITTVDEYVRAIAKRS